MDKPLVVVSGTITRNAREELEQLATRADRSLSAEVRRAISAHLLREHAADLDETEPA